MSAGSEPEHKAIDLWLTALKAVERLFPKATGPMGHVPTLKQQVRTSVGKGRDSTGT